MAKLRTDGISVFRPRAEGLEQMLGALEAQVMEAVWESPDPICVDDVRRTLAGHGKNAAYTTIMTTLARLYNKGLLSREMQGKAYYYAAAVSRRELGSNVTRQVIDGLLSTFAEPAMSYFVDALGEDDPGKLDLLASLIDRKKKEQREEE